MKQNSQKAEKTHYGILVERCAVICMPRITDSVLSYNLIDNFATILHRRMIITWRA